MRKKRKGDGIIGSLSDFLKKYGRRSVLINTLILSLLVGMLLLGVLSAAFYGIFASYSTEQVIRVSQNSLRQATESLNLTLNSLYRQMEREYRFNSTLIMGMESGSLEPRDYAAIFNTLREIVESNEAFDSAYVYNYREGTFFSSIGVMQNTDRFYDSDIFAMLNQHREINDRKIIHTVHCRHLTYSYGATIHSLNVITYIFNEPGTDAYLVFNINQDSLQHIIVSGSQDPSARSMIIDMDGVVVSDSQTQHIFENYSGEPYFEQLLQNASGWLLSSVENRDTLISYNRFNQYTGLNWIILQMYDYRSLADGIREILTIVLLTSIVVALLLIVCLFWVVGRIFVSIERVIRLVDKGEIEIKKATENEFEHLESSILNLSENFEQLSRAYDLPTLQNAFLLQLAYHGPTPEFASQCRQLSLSEEGEYRVVLFKCGTDDLLQAKLKEKVAQVLCDCKGFLLLDDHTQGCIGCTIDTSMKMAVLHERIQTIQENLPPIPVGIGDICSLENLQASYCASLAAIGYSYVFGSNAIINYLDIAERENSEYEYPSQLEQRILRRIKAGDDPADHLDEILMAIQCMSIFQINLALRQLLLAIVNALPETENRQNAMHSDMVSLTYELEQLTTLSDVRQWLWTLITDSMEYQKKKRDLRLHELVEAIKDDVRKRYMQPDLSVESIAQNVGLSANYVRTLFKEHEHITLSKHINDIRFQEAVHLLSTTAIPAIHIGKTVGFQSGSYFYTAFRRAMGKTPEEYRAGYNEKE